MKTRTKLTALIALVGALTVALFLGGCIGAPQSNEKEAVSNSEYMSQVNTIMDNLNQDFDNFEKAVAGNDLVGMKTQVDKLSKIIDDLESTEVPEEMKDIQKEYVEGSKLLQKALSDYVDLYTEIDTATDEAPFDASTYQKRIEDIQKTYNEGLGKLQSADNKATEK